MEIFDDNGAYFDFICLFLREIRNFYEWKICPKACIRLELVKKVGGPNFRDPGPHSREFGSPDMPNFPGVSGSGIPGRRY